MPLGEMVAISNQSILARAVITVKIAPSSNPSFRSRHNFVLQTFASAGAWATPEIVQALIARPIDEPRQFQRRGQWAIDIDHIWYPYCFRLCSDVQGSIYTFPAFLNSDAFLSSDAELATSR